MKKYLNYSLIYAITALAAGVFYREFTKVMGFSGTTTLGKAHGHLFMLGMIVFLIIALFSAHFKEIKDKKPFRVFMCVYNTGVPLTAIMMLVRGVFQVMGTELSKGANAAISGIAGIGHILVGVGIILLIVSLKQCAAENEKTKEATK